jgi:hypothetical protein
MINNESFVFYESFYKQLMQIANRVGPEAAISLLNDMAQFGLYGVWPDDDSESFLYGFEGIATAISSAKDRHNKAKVDGAKGGRPKVDLDKTTVYAAYEELHNWTKVAARFNVSDRTLRDKRKEWESEKTENSGNNVEFSGKNFSSDENFRAEKTEISGTSGKNLNVNVNANVNENAPRVPRSEGATPPNPQAPGGDNKIQGKRREFDF